MKKLTKSLLFLIPLSITPYAYAEEEGASGNVYYEQAVELMQGLTLINGQFIPTHTLNNNNLSSPSSPHTADFLALYDPNGVSEFLEDYFNNDWPSDSFSSIEEWMADHGVSSLDELAYQYGHSDPTTAFVSTLLPSEQAALFRSLAQGAAAHLMNWLPPENMNSMLAALPAGEAGPALNLRALLDNLNFSGLDLTGFDTAGKDLFGVNFTGSSISVAQLNAASSLYYANLSGLQNLQDLNTAGKTLGGVNFSGSNISAAQLNAASHINGANLSGLQNLQDLVTAGRDLGGVNFSGSNISVAQLNAASGIGWSNLSGLQNLQDLNTAGRSLSGVNFTGSNISAAQLNAAAQIEGANLSGLQNLQDLVTAWKNLGNVNFSGSNISAAQLNAAEHINGANLSGTGITRADLEASGKWHDYELNSITF